MRKGKLQQETPRPFKPAGWMIVDHQSGLLLGFGRNRRILARRIYEEEGGTLKNHDVDGFAISYRLLRYLEQQADACSPEDWAEVPGFSGYMDIVSD